MKNEEFYKWVFKAKGRKDKSKLVKKIITDKRGRLTTVWVNPEEEKEQKKTLLERVLEFFGFKNKDELEKRIKADYESMKIHDDGLTVKEFGDHVMEYFSNKVRWDNYFGKMEGKPLPKGGRTAGAKNKKKRKTEAVVGKEEKKWNIDVMRKIYTAEIEEKYKQKVEVQPDVKEKPKDIMEISRIPKVEYKEEKTENGVIAHIQGDDPRYVLKQYGVRPQLVSKESIIYTNDKVRSEGYLVTSKVIVKLNESTLKQVTDKSKNIVNQNDISIIDTLISEAKEKPGKDLKLAMYYSGDEDEESGKNNGVVVYQTKDGEKIQINARHAYAIHGYYPDAKVKYVIRDNGNILVCFYYDDGKIVAFVPGVEYEEEKNR